MTVEAQIAAARGARQRRRRINLAALSAAFVLFLVSDWLVAEGSPAKGLVGLGLAAIFAGVQMDPRSDPLQRHTALLAFALGAGVGILWLVVNTVWAMTSDGHQIAPGGTLQVFASAWMAAGLVLHLRLDRTTRQR